MYKLISGNLFLNPYSIIKGVLLTIITGYLRSLYFYETIGTTLVKKGNLVKFIEYGDSNAFNGSLKQINLHFAFIAIERISHPSSTCLSNAHGYLDERPNLIVVKGQSTSSPLYNYFLYSLKVSLSKPYI